MNIFLHKKNTFKKIKRGFVLPFTLFICSVMILISVGISAVLSKQIYFSKLARESQSAYYAADDAVACILAIDETYTDDNGMGIFPASSTPMTSSVADAEVTRVFDSAINRRALLGPDGLPIGKPLADSRTDIKCGQSVIFGADFSIKDTSNPADLYQRKDILPVIEYGQTSYTTLRMEVASGVFRCAKVTINKTASWRQIVAQGYSYCDRANAVERSVVDTTVTN